MELCLSCTNPSICDNDEDADSDNDNNVDDKWSDRRTDRYMLLKGLRPVLKGFVVTMHEGEFKTGSQIPRPIGWGIWRTFCTNPSALWQKTDRSVLITNIKWHFQFHLVNVSILHLKYEFGARSVSHFACHLHCYIMWCLLITGIVSSQCLSARDTVLMTCCLTPLISACLKRLKRILPQ